MHTPASAAHAPLSESSAPGQAHGRLLPVYLGALVLWMVTRGLVLAHQGNELWMNSYVVESAGEMLAGKWDRAFVRPPLPALLAAPFLQLGLSDQQVVGVLYLFASLIQFAAFALLMRLVFAGRAREQVLALLLLLLLPLNHSIHHYRNLPTVLASSAVFLLSAHYLWVTSPRSPRLLSLRSVLWVLGALVLGALSRTEVLVFGSLLLAFAAFGQRPRLPRLGLLYAAGIMAIVTGLVVATRLADADAAYTEHYRVSTFLNSTPFWWLTPECQARFTESCAEVDGSAYFGIADQEGGLVGMVRTHPGLVLVKSVLGAAINAQTLLLFNPSTYPPFFWLLWLAPLVYPASRTLLRGLPPGAWVTAGAALAITLLPPLTWAPAYPQYHLHTLFPAAMVTVPLLAALWRAPFGKWPVALFWLANAALTVLRYTRYTGMGN